MLFGQQNISVRFLPNPKLPTPTLSRCLSRRSLDSACQPPIPDVLEIFRHQISQQGNHQFRLLRLLPPCEIARTREGLTSRSCPAFWAVIPKHPLIVGEQLRRCEHRGRILETAIWVCRLEIQSPTICNQWLRTCQHRPWARKRPFASEAIPIDPPAWFIPLTRVSEGLGIHVGHLDAGCVRKRAEHVLANTMTRSDRHRRTRLLGWSDELIVGKAVVDRASAAIAIAIAAARKLSQWLN